MTQPNSTWTFCCICHDILDDNSKTTLLKCNHKFHTRCLINWLNSCNDKQECAFCKDKVNMVFQNIYNLYFDTNKIIKYNYNLN